MKSDEEKDKKSAFKKRTICKTRSIKPDYRATITQSLMFIPVIRCEEEDLYFIVVECIQAPLCLPRRLLASLGSVFLLLRPGVILAQRKRWRLQPTADQPYNGSSITSDTTTGKIPWIQSIARGGWIWLVWFGWLLVGFLPWLLCLCAGLRWIALDCLNHL